MSESEERELPEGWARARLKELLVEGPTNGYSPPSGPGASGSKSLKLSATSSGRFVLNERTTKVVYEAVPPTSKFWLRPGDLLIQRANSLEYLGSAAIVPEDVGASIYPDLMMRVRCTSPASTRYLWRYLNSHQAKAHFRENATGTAGNMPKINAKIVGDLSVPVPPADEQKRIVARIDALTEKSRETREALAEVPELLDKLRQSILAAAFRGDLTKEWRAKNPNMEPASVLLERIRQERRKKWEEAQLAKFQAKGKLPKDDSWKKKYLEPQPVDTTDLPELPEGWCWASILELSWDAGYGTSSKCDYDFDGPPVLRIPNIAHGAVNLADLKRCKAQEHNPDLEIAKNDLLIIRTNGSLGLVGRGALVTRREPHPISFASYLIRLRLLPSVAAWAAAIWSAPQLRRHIEHLASSSAGQHNVSLSKLETLAIPLPPDSELPAVLGNLQMQLNAFTALLHVGFEEGALLERLDSAILAKAFRGELVPQDPDDEPASVLLERIAAERATARRAAAESNGKKPRSRRAK